MEHFHASFGFSRAIVIRSGASTRDWHAVRRRRGKEPFAHTQNQEHLHTPPPPKTATLTLTPLPSLTQSYMTVTNQSRWLHTVVAGTGTLHIPDPSSHCCVLHCFDSGWAADASPTSTRQPMAVNVQSHSPYKLPLLAAMPVQYKAQRELTGQSTSAHKNLYRLLQSHKRGTQPQPSG